MLIIQSETDSSRKASLHGSMPSAVRSAPIDVFVGRRLQMRRLHHSLSQIDLAASLEITTDAVAAYERGEVRVKPSHLIQIADLLDVDLIFFFTAD